MAWNTLRPTPFTTAPHLWWILEDFYTNYGGANSKLLGHGDGISTWNNNGTPTTAGARFTASTPYAAVANGMGTNLSWARRRLPNNLGELCLQYSTSSTVNLTQRIKYSPAATFTGGSPSATRVPSAADEIVFVGAGTDASPTFSSSSLIYNTFFNATSGRVIARVQDAAPFMWWWSIPGPTGAWPLALSFMDNLTNRATSDSTDPYLLSMYRAASAGTRPGEYLGLGSPNADTVTYARMNVAGTYPVVTGWYPVVQDSGGTIQPLIGTLGPRAADGLFLGRRPRWGLYSGAATPNGKKGVSQLNSWRLTTVQGVLSYASRSDKIAIGDLIFDWDGSDQSF